MENMVENKDLNFFVNKRIFITGHTGFKGSWLSYILDKNKSIVKGYSLSPNTSPSLFSQLKFSDQFSSVIADLTSSTRILFTSIFRLASFTTLSYNEKV